MKIYAIFRFTKFCNYFIIKFVPFAVSFTSSECKVRAVIATLNFSELGQLSKLHLSGILGCTLSFVWKLQCLWRLEFGVLMMFSPHLILANHFNEKRFWCRGPAARFGCLIMLVKLKMLVYLDFVSWPFISFCCFCHLFEFKKLCDSNCKFQHIRQSFSNLQAFHWTSLVTTSARFFNPWVISARSKLLSIKVLKHTLLMTCIMFFDDLIMFCFSREICKLFAFINKLLHVEFHILTTVLLPIFQAWQNVATN